MFFSLNTSHIFKKSIHKFLYIRLNLYYINQITNLCNLNEIYQTKDLDWNNFFQNKLLFINLRNCETKLTFFTNSMFWYKDNWYCHVTTFQLICPLSCFTVLLSKFVFPVHYLPLSSHTFCTKYDIQVICIKRSIKTIY